MFTFSDSRGPPTVSIGLTVAALAALLASAIAWSVFHVPWVTRTDLRVGAWLQAHAEPALTTAMVAVSWLHATPAVWIATIALCGFFAWRRKPAWIALTLLVLPGGTLFNWSLKHLFQRARPTEGVYVQALHSYSFPSGHTVFATLLYGLLAFWLASVLRGRATRVGIFSMALASIGTVAFSRVYLGVHFLSDVLAAFCVGVFWLALCVAVVTARQLPMVSAPTR